eukprot:11306930-Alexandrium_andersonii.AAC.1
MPLLPLEPVGAVRTSFTQTRFSHARLSVACSDGSSSPCTITDSWPRLRNQRFSVSTVYRSRGPLLKQCVAKPIE